MIKLLRRRGWTRADFWTARLGREGCVKTPSSSARATGADGKRGIRYRARDAALLLSASLLTACATPPEPKIITKLVNVPVAIKCAAQLNSEPTYSDTPESLRAAPDIFERTKLLLAGRAQRNARITELTAAISGCVG